MIAKDANMTRSTNHMSTPTFKLVLVAALVLTLVTALVAQVSQANESGETRSFFSRALTLKSQPQSMVTKRAGGQIQRLPAAQRRDLGLLAIKAILLGPLIGLTIKAALIRGLIWALIAYVGHLFFPALLSSLGLGTGLVGFARQLRPDYSHLLANYLSNLHIAMPNSFQQVARQYQQLLSPVVESIRAIPEGHCRFRAVCETASHLVRQTRSLSTSLQRISATVYMNFGTDYSKAWLDGIVQSDCAAKYAQCQGSPFSMVAARLAQSLGVGQQQLAMQQQQQLLLPAAPLGGATTTPAASLSAAATATATATAAANQQALAGQVTGAV